MSSQKNSQIAQLTDYTISESRLSPNYKIFLHDLASALFYPKIEYAKSMNTKYLDMFLNMQLGGLQTLTVNSLYYTSLAIKLFIEQSKDKDGTKQNLVNKIMQNFDMYDKSSAENILNRTVADILGQVSKELNDIKKDNESDGKQQGYRNDQAYINNGHRNKILKHATKINSIISKVTEQIVNKFLSTYNTLNMTHLAAGNLLQDQDYIDIIDYESLATKLPFDISTLVFQKNLRVNLYLDISGSMNEKRIIKSQSIAYHLWKMRLTKEIFYFNTYLISEVRERESSKETLNSTKDFLKTLGTFSYGGTSFDPIVEKINQSKKVLSFIITDGEASKIPYSKHIIYLLLADYTYGIDEKYIKNKQVIVCEDGAKEARYATLQE